MYKDKERVKKDKTVAFLWSLELAGSMIGYNSQKVVILNHFHIGKNRAIGFVGGALPVKVELERDNGNAISTTIFLPRSQIQVVDGGIIAPLWLVRAKEKSTAGLKFDLLLADGKDRDGVKFDLNDREFNPNR